MTEAEKFLVAYGCDLEAMRRDGFEAFQDFQLDAITERHRLRDEFIQRFGFAVLDSQTIEALRPYAPLVEVGAGSGYWAWELMRAGVDIVATDPGTSRYGPLNGKVWHPWTKVRRLSGIEALRRFRARNLLVVWPDYDDPWAASTLKAFQGKTVCYVGEGSGGCTSDDEFHRLLEERFRLISEVPIPKFDGFHDSLMIYRRSRSRF